MASHTRFCIIAFFYLLATKLSDAHEAPAPTPSKPPAAAPQSHPPSTAHSPTNSPWGSPESQPQGGTETEVQEIKEEMRFLDVEKKCWSKMFGNLTLPPSIYNSISFPPPPVLLAGAIAMSQRVHAKRTSTFEAPEVKAEILKALEVPAGGGPLTIDPRIEAKIVKNLKAVMYDSSGGDVDQELDLKVKKFVEFLASGSKTGEGGSSLDLSSKMSKQEIESFREQMSIILGGNVPGEGLDSKADLGGNVGFTRIPPTSSILPIAKCTGPPQLVNEVHDKTVESLFFKARQLDPGAKFTLQFTKSKNHAAFMSSAMMDKSGMMSSFVLMDMVSLLAESTNGKQDANIVPEVDTISICDQPATKGKNKDKCCATDVETMLNYTISKLGKDLRSASMWIEVRPESVTKLQEYTITKIHKLPAVTIVGCSKMSFSIAVFYCQHLPKTVVYTVSLLGADGTKVKAPILCHEDTTMWNPKSWIFKLLGVQPEPSTKICHFLAADDIAWMPKTQENTAD